MIPPINTARHRPGERTKVGIAGWLGLLSKNRSVRFSGLRPEGVQSVELLRLVVPVDREQIAPDPTAHRLDHAQHRVRRNGGIDRIPPGLQEIKPRLGRQRGLVATIRVWRSRPSGSGCGSLAGRSYSARAEVRSIRKTPERRTFACEASREGTPALWATPVMIARRPAGSITVRADSRAPLPGGTAMISYDVQVSF